MNKYHLSRKTYTYENNVSNFHEILPSSCNKESSTKLYRVVIIQNTNTKSKHISFNLRGFEYHQLKHLHLIPINIMQLQAPSSRRYQTEIFDRLLLEWPERTGSTWAPTAPVPVSPIRFAGRGCPSSGPVGAITRAATFVPRFRATPTRRTWSSMTRRNIAAVPSAIDSSPLEVMLTSIWPKMWTNSKGIQEWSGPVLKMVHMSYAQWACLPSTYRNKVRTRALLEQENVCILALLLELFPVLRALFLGGPHDRRVITENKRRVPRARGVLCM